MTQVNMQIGKNGLTENFIAGLKTAFKTHEFVKISVHQHKSETKEMAEKILEKLGRKYTCKIIGFRITIKKWRKNKR